MGVKISPSLKDSLIARLKLPVFRYVISVGASQLLSSVSGIVAMRFLEPLTLGWWNSAQMVKIPLDLTRMGILNGLNREYPYLIGKGKPNQAQRFLEAGLAHTLAMILLGQLGTALVLIPLRNASLYLICAIVAASTIWGLSYYTQFIRAMLRSSHEFGRVGPIELAVSTVDAVAVLAVWQWGFWGLLGRGVFTAIVLATVFYWIQPTNVSPRWDWKALGQMFKFGRHAFITNWLGLLGQQADRIWILGAFNDVRMLGNYSVAISCMGFLGMIPGSAINYFYPQWVKEFGRQQDRRALAMVIFRQIKRISILMIPISIIIAICFHFLIQNILPQYKEAERAAQLACLAGPLYSMRLCTIYYASVAQWREYWLYTGIQTIIPFILIPLLMCIIPPLEAAVLGALGAMALSGFFLCYMTCRDSSKIQA